MNINQLFSEQLLSDQWRSSVSLCCDALERDDLRQVSVYNSWDDVQKQILMDTSNQPHNQDLAMLAPRLTNLRTFTDFWLRQLIPQLDTSIFWGLVRLIVKVFMNLTAIHEKLTKVTLKLVQEESITLGRIPQMLRELCHKIELLSRYCTEPHSLTAQLKESCVEVGLELLSFFSYAIKFMRTEVAYWTSGR
jgi:hypothetical protein